MKKIVYFLLIIPCLIFGQVQNDADLTSQINSTIRGRVFNAKSHADMFKTVVDSKLNRSSLGGFLTGTITGNQTVDIGTNAFGIEGSGAGGTIRLFGKFPDSGFLISPTGLQAYGQIQFFGKLLPLADGGQSRFGLGGLGTDPTTNVFNGDMYYNSVSHYFSGRINGAWIPFVGTTTSQNLTNKSFGSGTVFSSAPTINDGLKFTFNPNGTNAGLNFGSHTANPSSPVNGDAYYNSTTNQLFAYINGAWVALGSGGGSFTNGAANNELIKSNGTNGVASGIFSSSTGTIQLGDDSFTGNATISAAGNDANENLNLSAKGLGSVRGFGLTMSIEAAGNTGFRAINTSTNASAQFDLNQIVFNGPTASSASTVNIKGQTSLGGTGDGGDLVIGAGDGILAGNGDGGNTIIEPGSGTGSGVDGNVYTRHQGELINLALFEPVSETGTSFTFDYSHLSKLVVCTNGSAQTATVPALQVGYITKVVQDGAGAFSLTAGANVVLVGKTSTSGVGDTIVIHAYKTSGSDTYYLCE